MKKINKKLPKYVLGKRGRNLPIGYQPSKTIGGELFDSTPGMSIDSDVRTLLKNYIPQTLLALSLNVTPITLMLLNTVKVPIYTATAASMAPNAGVSLSSLLPVTNAASTAITNGAGLAFGTGTTAHATTFFSDVAGNAVEPVAEKAVETTAQTGSRTALTTAGRALGVLGTLYGGYNMYGDISNFGSHRTAADMALTFGTNRYSTAGGNTYTIKTGPNLQEELAFEKQMAKQKQTNFLLNAAGTGASAGAVAGSFIPGIGNLLGMGLGAGLGTLVGTVGSLLGWGDNSDEIQDTIRKIDESLALSNQQEEAVARSKDYETAANGKRPVWSPGGLIKRNATARISNGEILGNFEDGKAVRIPGLKNNKDTKLASVADDDFIISNKYGLSDYAAETGDYKGALALQEMLLGDMRNIKGYKKGKLPHYKLGLGTIGEYALATLPHFSLMMNNLLRLREAKYADIYAPDVYAEDTLGRKAVNTLATLKFDPSQYLYDAFKAYKLALWDTNREVGLGTGGRIIAKNANFRSYLNSLGNIRIAEQLENNKLATNTANAIATLGAANRQARMNSNIHKHNWLQQAAGQKYNADVTFGNNYDTAFTNLAADAIRMLQYNKAQALQQKQLSLWDKMARLNELNL